LINQTYQNIEIILVNDGSTDQSGKVCDAYQKKDDRVKVIHKTNGGLSDARNFGLKIACGNYTLFVDSDDYIDLEAIERLYTYATTNQLDVVCGNARVIEDNKYKNTLVEFEEQEISNGLDTLIKSIKKKNYTAAVWTRMYESSLLIQNNLLFKKGILHEDEEWTPRVLAQAKRVGFYNYAFYNYIIRNDSITQKKEKSKHIADVMNTCMELDNYFEELNLNKQDKNTLKDYLARLYMNTSLYGEFDKRYYNSKVSKNFPLTRACFYLSKTEALIFFINIKLYVFLKKKISNFRKSIRV